VLCKEVSMSTNHSFVKSDRHHFSGVLQRARLSGKESRHFPRRFTGTAQGLEVGSGDVKGALVSVLAQSFIFKLWLMVATRQILKYFLLYIMAACNGRVSGTLAYHVLPGFIVMFALSYQYCLLLELSDCCKMSLLTNKITF